MGQGTSMTQLTAHFTLEEFQKRDSIPEDCIPIFTELAAKILEPIRGVFDKPLVITSGYRSPSENAEAHGQPNSEHMATPTMCACDFYIEGIGTRFVFDWLRNSPAFPFHQLILEADAHGSSIIHVSINKMMIGIRSVLTGATHNSAPYVKCDYIPYNPDSADKVST
jgi:zinc D-Ala-D-Ala carboxypeptidase